MTKNFIGRKKFYASRKSFFLLLINLKNWFLASQNKFVKFLPPRKKFLSMHKIFSNLKNFSSQNFLDVKFFCIENFCFTKIFSKNIFFDLIFPIECQMDLDPKNSMNWGPFWPILRKNSPARANLVLSAEPVHSLKGAFANPRF